MRNTEKKSVIKDVRIGVGLFNICRFLQKHKSRALTDGATGCIHNYTQFRYYILNMAKKWCMVLLSDSQKTQKFTYHYYV